MNLSILLKTSIIFAKLVQKASRLLNKNGSNIPGVIARKIDKNVLKKLAKKTDKIIFISGTNGKTTTSQIVAHIFRENGYKLIHNTEGSNMITGITTAFINNERIFSDNHADVAVIEIDEGSIPRVMKEVTPDVMVFTNFFRDQLDRFGEIDTLIQTISDTIKPTNVKLVLNADDPFASRLGLIGLETVYYGLSEGSFPFESHEMIESTFCPNCGSPLEYTYEHYGQLGHYRCDCGFERQEPKYEGNHISLNAVLRLETNWGDFQIPLLGSYNAYNVLAAISVCLEFGLKHEQITQALNKFHLANGRMEGFSLEGHRAILNLAKNPAGVNVSLSESKYSDNKRQYLFVLNDNQADGIDISWIWDADYEKIADEKTERVLCSGLRAEELALRMKYAGIPIEKIVIIKSITEAVEELVNVPMESYIIPNYTALEITRTELIKQLKHLNSPQGALEVG